MPTSRYDPPPLQEGRAAPILVITSLNGSSTEISGWQIGEVSFNQMVKPGDDIGLTLARSLGIRVVTVTDPTYIPIQMEVWSLADKLHDKIVELGYQHEVLFKD